MQAVASHQRHAVPDRENLSRARSCVYSQDKLHRLPTRVCRPKSSDRLPGWRKLSSGYLRVAYRAWQLDEWVMIYPCTRGIRLGSHATETTLPRPAAGFIETMDRLPVSRLPEGPEWTSKLSWTAIGLRSCGVVAKQQSILAGRCVEPEVSLHCSGIERPSR